MQQPGVASQPRSPGDTQTRPGLGLATLTAGTRTRCSICWPPG